jgi:8-oxo-dGTP pyrophosphatase MutT (NUDIX family)
MTSSAIRLPGQFAGRVRDILEGRVQPPPPRDASTVLLLRPEPQGAESSARLGGGFEVYLLRRKRSMAFAPGAHVFPGGSVDPRDAETQSAWAGPDPAALASILAPEFADSTLTVSDPQPHAGGPGPSGVRGSPPADTVPPRKQRSLNGSAELARALICAAVRETFEESGVLLAGPAPDAVVADTTDDSFEADRRALIDRSLSLAEMLQRRHLVLRADLLTPWARWVTPVLEGRRFDTRFFAATLPAGQRTRDVSGEADEVAWLAPAAAIAAARRREIMLMPPTAVSLAELCRYGSVAEALAAEGDMAPRQPSVALVDGEAWLTIPDGLEYPL